MDKLQISNEDIGFRIKKSRSTALLTQEDLAEALDKSKQFVSDLECGRVGMSLSTLIDLCTILKVSSDYILFGRVSDYELTPTIDRVLNLNDVNRRKVEKGIDTLIDLVSPYGENENADD